MLPNLLVLFTTLSPFSRRVTGDGGGTSPHAGLGVEIDIAQYLPVVPGEESLRKMSSLATASTKTPRSVLTNTTRLYVLVRHEVVSRREKAAGESVRERQPFEDNEICP